MDRQIARQRTRVGRHGLAVLVITILLGGPAGRADDRYFSYSYEPKVLPKGAREFEQWTTLRTGKDEGIYNRWDLRSEFEFGLTDNLNTALYLNFKSLHIDKEDDALDEDEFEFEGVSSEWKYKILDPTADPLGLLLYGEVTFAGHELELEEKLVLGKDYERLVLAFNLGFEQEWEFERDESGSKTEKELVLEFTAGAAYKITNRFALGLEVRETNVFPDMDNLEHAALFLGPVLHYSADNFWVTFTVLPQIVAFKGTTGGGVNLDEFERAEIRLLLGIPF